MQTSAAGNRALGAASWLVLCALLAYAICVAVQSTEWRMELDAPLLHYMAFMLDEQDAVPYRDVFVTSFPGALLFHLLVQKTLGLGDRAFMIASLIWLSGLSAVTFGILRPFGVRAALGGGVLFAIAYFFKGADMMLQRDFVLVLPIAGALLVHASERGRPKARAFWIGFLFALAATVKPHSAIGLPAVLLAELARQREGGRSATLRDHASALVFAALGLALPLGAMFLWLAWTGGLSAFLDMVREYLPLHVRLSRNHEYLEGKQRLFDFIWWAARFGEEPGWLIASAVGSLAYLASRELDARRRRIVLLLVAMSALHWLYVLVAGQFWNYHWMPFRWTTALLAALCFAPPASLRADRIAAWHPLGSLLLAIAVVLPISEETFAQFQGGELAQPDEGRVDEIAAYLADHLRPGDTVQTLDWARGGVHAALTAKAHAATSFVEDYHFYHHVHLPYVVELRARFLREMRAHPPRFVLDMQDRPRPTGKYTTTEFPELQALLANAYEVVLETSDPHAKWVVYERKP